MTPDPLSQRMVWNGLEADKHTPSKSACPRGSLSYYTGFHVCSVRTY